MFKSLLGNLFGASKTEVPPEKRPELILEPSSNVYDYVPDPIDMCFCGSEKFFKSCCGSREHSRKPPYGVFVFKNYLDAEKIQTLRDFADQCSGERVMVIERIPFSNETKYVADERRVSEKVQIDAKQQLLNDIVKNTFLDLTEKCIGRELQWCEKPQLLRYHPGGFYINHADNENMSAETRTWTRVADRDLSLLIYLNDDFKGGELFFNKFNYRIKPQPGMAVLFPSDNRYMHTAETVTKGIRYAIVSWAAIRGTTKLYPTPPAESLFFD